MLGPWVKYFPSKFIFPINTWGNVNYSFLEETKHGGEGKGALSPSPSLSGRHFSLRRFLGDIPV